MGAMAVMVMATAVPVLADSDAPPPQTPVPAAAGLDPDLLPDAQDVAAGIAQSVREEAREQAARETPAAVEERLESQQLFADLDPQEARSLFIEEFAEQLKVLNADPARFLSDVRLESTLEDGTVARVNDEGVPEFLDAGIPVNAEDENGAIKKVDLTIVDAPAEGLEPVNPLTDLTLPENAGEAVEVGDRGLSIEPLGVEAASGAEPFGDKGLFYPSVHVDTDLVIVPIASGVEIFDQLRSSDSPHTLRFRIGMPAAAELRPDGSGGAEVVLGGEVLGRVPFPTALDAQGAEVPVELTVEGNQLVLEVLTPEEDLAYPVSVDPSLVEDWHTASWYSGQNLQALTNGSWAWNGGGTNWIYGKISCIWTCWGSGHGLYVSAESGYHAANQKGQWAYGPPGGTSYISGASINPFWRNNYNNCPASLYPQPHDYDGLWSQALGWSPLETNRANNYGNAAPSGYGKALIIGLGNAEQGAENKCRRDIMAGGVAIWIGDPEPPSWSSAPTVADQWIDTAAIPVSASATDPGLGMKYFNLWTTDSTGKNQSLVGNSVHPCSGLFVSPCPGSWSSQVTNYNPAGLPTGINKMNTVAYDALGIEHSSTAGPIFLKVDHANPTISFSGELLKPSPAKFHLDVTAKDGNPSSLGTAQSGMKSLEFFVDGQLAGRYPDTATPPACVNVQEGRNVGSCEFADVGFDLNRSLSGKHVIKVVAKDSLGHPSDESIEVNLPPDTTAPQVTASGPLFAAAGGWMKAAATSVTAEATDAETGVVEESVLIDGVPAVTPFAQECPYGGCSFTRTFAPSLASYAEGPHAVTVKAKDGAGKVGEASWTVKVDRNIPSLTSISAPEVPVGWTPQLESFNLGFKATDAGVGIKKVEVSRPSGFGIALKSNAYSSTCTGSAASPCAGTVEGSAPISTASMAEGTDTVTVKAYDAFERVSTEKTVKVNVDRTTPTMTVTGPLLNASSSTLIGLGTKVGLTVKDGGSGVESIELSLDGEVEEALSLEEVLAAGGTQTCTATSCELKYSFSSLLGEAKEPGLYTVEIAVEDKAGHVATKSNAVKLDTRPPELDLSGPLVDAIGEPLSADPAAVLAAASDGEGAFAAGLTNLTVEIDGTKVLTQRAGTGAAAGEERLWVADEENDRVQGFNRNGEAIVSFGTSGSGNGRLDRPTGVAVDAKGNFWVTDAGNHRLVQFDEDGSFVKAVGSPGNGNGAFSGPEGIAIDSSGNIWVADTYNARIQKFNDKGEFLQAVGTYGSGAGQLIEPTGIAIAPGGNVWTTDWANNKVVVFTSSGQFVRQFGTSGAGPGQFARPDAITIDGGGDVWVGDQNNNRVQLFNLHGEYVTHVGSAGSGAGQFSFSFPIGLATDSQGALWVSDSNNNRVQRWNIGNYSPTATPTYATAFGTLGNAAGQMEHPADVAVDAKGNLWVVDQNNDRVQQYNPKGTYLTDYGATGSGNGQFNRPTAIAIDAQGNLWITDAGNSRVQVLNEKGEFVRAFGSPGSGNGQFGGSGPEGIAIDAKGNVWVSDTYGARIQKFSSLGLFQQAIGAKGSGSGQLLEPTGIDIGPGGNVWVADWANNKVVAYSENGTFVRQFGVYGTGNGQFSNPDGLEVDSRGTVWVGDQNNHRVQAFSQTGGYLTKFGSLGTGAGQFTFGYPLGLAVDAKGVIWIADSLNNRVQKWTIPNYVPTYVFSFGGPGGGEGQFAHPAGISVAAGRKCLAGECPSQMTTEYGYSETFWGSGPHSVTVTAVDAAGNKTAEEVRVNEPLNVVAPECPTATPETLEAGTVRSPSAAVAAIETSLPEVVEPNEAPEEEAELQAAEEEGAEPAEPVIDPAVTRNPEGVSLDEQGIDVVGSAMGGGVEDEASGAFTVGQEVCLQPLQEGAAAHTPAVVEGAAVVYPNALPDTDTVVRPSALGTTVVEYRRGAKAPAEFRWKVGLEPGEELVQLANGGIAVVDPQREDSEEEEVPGEPPGGWGLEELNEVEAQLAEAERELALANNQLSGEVQTVIAAPQVVLSSGQVVPGLLRITGGSVVVAELPPGTFAEAEALIIKANPAAKTEDICAHVMASRPQYYRSVCIPGTESEPNEQPDYAETLTLLDATAHIPQPLQGRILQADQRFEALYGPPGLVPIEIWEGMTEEEKELCVEDKDFKRCLRMINAGARAAEIEDKLFNVPEGSGGTKANAFRHAFWTLSMEVSEGYDGFGMLWARAHEGREYNNSKNPIRRKASQQDMMNNMVGWFNAEQNPKKTLTACTDMISKVGRAIYLGTDVYPYRWSKKNEWEMYRLVYRKLRDFRPSDQGVVVLRNGKNCKEVW